MNKFDESIKSTAVDAIIESKRQLDHIVNNNNLFGYALCTEDSVSGIYHVACTNEWVKEKSGKYKEIGYISVEWDLSAEHQIFEKLNQKLTDNYELYKDDFEEYRDIRFESLVLALQECRKRGIFNDNTHLSVGGTDPCDHLEYLETKGIERVNKPGLIELLVEALCFEKYRDTNS